MKVQGREKVCSNAFGILASIMFFIVLYYGLTLTGVHNGKNWDEHIYFREDSLLLNSFLLVLAVLAFGLIGKLYDCFLSKINRDIILAVFCLLVFGASIYWVANVKAIPQGDQSMVCQYANAFNLGDFGGFKKGMYLSVNSWQLGMVSFLRIIFKIFGYDNWRAFQYLSACMVPLIVYAGCKILRLITDNNGKIEWYYLIFSAFCFPMYVYTVFVYGEIISTALAMVAAWLILSCFRKFTWKKAISMGLILGLAVQLRTNVWIMVIAFLITIVVKLIGKWDRRILATGICALAGVVLIHAAHWGWYADKVDPKAQSVPASLYFIMGLNDDYQRNGWYNNYNYHAFAISDYDVKTANAKAREDFQTYINLYTSQPEYFVDFFERKMNAQWNAPMYQCLKMNNNIEEKLNPLLADIYDGQRVGKLIDWGMKVYQLLLYAAILVWTVTSLKKQKGIEQYILLIAVFGGFLFSLIWEAKTRYMFPYLLLMLPYGAMGVHVMTGGLEAWVKKRKEKKREELSLVKGDGSAQA